MKHRFEASKNSSPFQGMFLSVACSLAVVVCFWFGTSFVSDKTDEQEIQTLHRAVNRGIIHCYAIKGSYPESLQYLKDYYGLTYDEQKYFIDYQVLGSNILPDVTIIDRRNRP